MSVISLDPKLEKKYIEDSRKDKEKFAPLYKHYKEYIKKFFLYRVNTEQNAEELTAQTFEKALKGLDNFQWQGVSFSAWLYKIARNTLIDHYRKNDKRSEVSSLDQHYSLPSDDKSPEDKIEIMFSEDILHKVLQELPSREREIIYLKFFDGYTNKLIAELTDLSETNVGTIVHRVLKKLRKIYQENDDYFMSG